MKNVREPERVHTVVIGAGQAGLAVGYHLSRRAIPFVILEANERVGDSWRKRWDSLRLFSPARFDGLPGMPFPASPQDFPTKGEMGDYLEAYARRFALPVRTGMAVDRVSRRGDTYLVNAGDDQFEASHVVVAMSNYQKPQIPAFASQLDGGIVQLHSADYRSPSQLREGGVLIVGAGNSGAEIAMELARNGHQTLVSGPSTGAVPFRIRSFAGRNFFVPLVFRVLFHRILTLSTPIGRKARPKMMTGGTPLIRVKEKDMAAAGVERGPRTVGVQRGLPVLDDGRVLEVKNVIWCTGFHPGFSWLDLPVLDSSGEPAQHDRGVVANEPGLYFVGLHFLYAMSSAMIHGVGRDAEHVADVLVRREPAREPRGGDALRELATAS